ncbi:RHS repeat-associated core domain-containing protein [Rhodococcus sp. IEGM1300]
MQSNDETFLCRYQYDPLDRLAGGDPSEQGETQRFYLKDRLATEIQGAQQCSIMQQDDQLLAQQQHQNGVMATRLLATDQQRSVLTVLTPAGTDPLALTAYGHRPPENGLLSLLGFNGERPDPVTGHYLLGNGYRAFNPVLMRFNSPDSWSPFGKGGLNAYGYCLGNPVNRVDPTGHAIGNPFKGLMNFLQLRTPGRNRSAPVSTPDPRPVSPQAEPRANPSRPENSSGSDAITPSTSTGTGQRQPPPYERFTLPPSYRNDKLYQASKKALAVQFEKLAVENNLNKMETQLNNIDYFERLNKNLMRRKGERTIIIKHEKILKFIRDNT